MIANLVKVVTIGKLGSDLSALSAGGSSCWTLAGDFPFDPVIGIPMQGGTVRRSGTLGF